MCDKYTQERDEFMADKCTSCMGYVNPDTNECEKYFCSRKWMTGTGTAQYEVRPHKGKTYMQGRKIFDR